MRYARIFIIAITVFLFGCVTEKTGVFTAKADSEAALNHSVQLARSYIRDRNWDAAKRHLKKALELDENNAQVHEALALVFQNTGELELADKHFVRAISLDPMLSRARNNYAVYLFQQERYQEAEAQLEKVSEDVLYERRAAAFVNLGRCRVKLSDFQGAEEALRRAQLMERANPMIAMELAEVYYELGEYAKAQRSYDLYRSRVPTQSSRGLWLGIRLAYEFRDNDAASSYELALKNLYPKSPEYLQFLERNR